ncbi:putative coiled-coil protein [Toxoplasma gondii FOU]|nr:putative coiled-coil protein [Toxoplasma gondii FOU]
MTRETAAQSCLGLAISRRERQEVFCIDCEDALIWTDWKVGRLSTKRLLLKNVGTEHQTLQYKVPQSRTFSLPFPEPFRLPPGMTKTFLVTFSPHHSQSVVEALEFVCDKGAFVIFLKATEKRAAVSIPRAIDFGLGAVAANTSIPFLVHNTGSLPVTVLWKDVQPFRILPETALIPVGRTEKFTALFHPPGPLAYEGVVVCSLISKHGDRKESEDLSSSVCNAEPRAGTLEEAEKEENNRATLQQPREDAALLKNASWAPDVETEAAQMYSMDVKGIGKIPHLHVKGKTEVAVDFGIVLCGTVETQTLLLDNSSSVRAHFEVLRIGNPPQGNLRASPVTVCSRSGVVEPGEHFPLTFTFHGHSVKEVFQEFQVVMKVGAPITVKVTGVVGHIEATLSSNHLHFGDVPVGRKITKQVQLRNLSKRASSYHFVNLQDSAFVCLDKPSGLLGAQTSVTLSFSFSSLVPLRFHKRAFCLVNGAEEPVVLDLLATAYDEGRPATLTLGHVYLKRWQELENALPPRDSLEFDCQGNPEKVPIPPETPTSLFKMLTTDFSDTSRGLSVSPSLVDFKCGESRRTLSVFNRTGEKFLCIWKDSLDRKRKKNPAHVFSVSPRRAELLPNSVTTFQ